MLICQSSPKRMSDTKSLYQPIQFGKLELNNRIALAPLTRFRAHDDHTPSDIMVDYYGMRAVGGQLLITEATFISERAGLYECVPGIWNSKHVEGWKKVSDRVHAEGGKIFMQLWSLGRTGSPKLLRSRGYDYVAPSAVKPLAPTLTGELEIPRAMTHKEIKGYVQDFVTAAKNAVAAGMDGVEIHGAHGYLPNQFLIEQANQRTDEYGGSIENRARFMLEIVDAVIDAIGAEKTGLRLSPWLNTGPTAEAYDVSPLPTYTYIMNELQRRANAGKQLAYLHVVEPRVAGYQDLDYEQFKKQSNDFVRMIWDGPLIRAGGYTKDLAEEHTGKDDNLMIAFGRRYIPNPDLPQRLHKNVELEPYDRKSFYTPQGPTGKHGYSSYKRLETENQAARL